MTREDALSLADSAQAFEDRPDDVAIMEALKLLADEARRKDVDADIGRQLQPLTEVSHKGNDAQWLQDCLEVQQEYLIRLRNAAVRYRNSRTQTAAEVAEAGEELDAALGACISPHPPETLHAVVAHAVGSCRNAIRALSHGEFDAAQGLMRHTEHELSEQLNKWDEVR